MLDIDFRAGRMTVLPYETDSFDYILSFNVIYHGDRQIVEAAIAEIRRVLRVGGVYQGTMLSKRNASFNLGEEVAPDTFVKPGADGDKAHPHFYCDARREKKSTAFAGRDDTSDVSAPLSTKAQPSNQSPTKQPKPNQARSFKEGSSCGDGL